MTCPDENLILEFLEGACSPDASAGFEDHLDGCAACRALVAELGRSLDGGGAAPTESEIPEQWQASSGGDVVTPGAQIGRFIALERIGAGAMGVVYRAYDPDLDRNVALKLIRVLDRAPVERVRARLLREAKAMARLSHPNVVAVYEASVVGDDVFVAMELVEGVELGAWLAGDRSLPRPAGARGPSRTGRSRREIVAVFAEAGRGLAAAHDAGVVHRDFKPANVLIDGDRRVRVTDFGLAAVEGAPQIAAGSGSPPPPDEGIAGAITDCGAVLGTPAYMSPEARAGEGDERSDQYSFAVALCEALAGERPVDGEIPAGAPIGSRLRPVIRRGLAADRDERFESMAAMVDALERANRPRGRGTLAIVGIAATAAVAAALAIAGRPDDRACDPAAKLERIWDAGERDAARRAFDATELSYAPDLFALAARNLDAYRDQWAGAYRAACEATHVRKEQSAATLDLRMECLDGELGRFESAADLLGAATPAIVGQAVSITALSDGLARCANAPLLRAETPRPIGADDEIERIAAEYRATNAMMIEGDYKAALDALTRLVARAGRVGYARMEAELYKELGLAQSRTGDPAAAEESLYRAIEAAERAGSPDIKSTAMTILVGMVGFTEGRHGEALALARVAEAATRPLDDPLRMAQLIGNGGAIHFGRGEMDRAGADFQRALDLTVEALGPGDYRVGKGLNNVAIVAAERGRLEEAIDSYGRALEIYKDTLGPGHPEVALALANRAIAYANSDRTGDAVADLERALEIRLAVFGPEHRAIGNTHAVLGEVRHEAGEPAAALEHYDKARAIYARAMAADNPEMAALRSGIGRALLALERRAEAIAELEAALEIWDKHKMSTGKSAQTRFALARAIAESGGDRAAAIAAATRARAEMAEHAPDNVEPIDRWLEAHR